jgi:hypothetical protein
LCNSCYQTHRQQFKSRATCHPDRPHSAKGLCRNCYRVSLEAVELNAKKQARWRRASLKYNFGLTEAEWDRMRDEQQNRCAMCRQEFGDLVKNRAHVDHCHATQKVRGLLCFRCNTALGIYEKLGEKAAEYLRERG